MWTGSFVIREIGASARELLFRVQLDQDPNRVVTIRLPRKSIHSFDKYLGRAIRDLETHSNGHHKTRPSGEIVWSAQHN